MAITFCTLLLFTTMLQAVVAQEIMKTTLAPHVTFGNGTRSCPSQQERERARQSINSAVRSIILGEDSPQNCGPGVWHRVAYLNMSDPSQRCPLGWRLYSTSGVRACGRQSDDCTSVTYPTDSRLYSKVCGRAIGYQIGSTDVFINQQRDIDADYVDGLSITHGTPRTHIWTFAAGASDNLISGDEVFSCPCLVSGSAFTPQTPPPYVGDNYYCESGNPTFTFENSNSLIYTSDLLWDGQQCEGQCCSNGKSPWFSVELPNPTRDNIELRICGTDTPAREDTPIKLFELYIQ